MAVKIITDRVRRILEKNISARESDQFLSATIWYNELIDLGIDKETALKLCRLIKDNKLTSFESISRSRRKVQEEVPSLRGRNYFERHRNKTKIRKELGYPG